jgi:hypothetical protein
MLLSIVLAIALQAAPSDSISGTWHVTGDVAGNPLDELCTLKQADTVLTGSCKAAKPDDAKAWAVSGVVKAGKVSFSHGGEYEGSPLTIAFAGTLASATQISGSVDVPEYAVSGAFTAVPVAPQAPAGPAKQ